MNSDHAISRELQVLLDRAETVRQETRELIAENERWRTLARQRLRLMYAIGLEFHHRPTIRYP